MEEISDSPAKVKLMIFFLLYEYVMMRYMKCDINSEQLH